MIKLLDKIEEIEAKADEYRDEERISHMTYCMGQINILMWLLKNSISSRHPESILFHLDDITTIPAGFKEEE
tara:strand:- start:636 stop:851 length:216 start_codon:yes stop_codon:yes gene_type:complete